MALTKLLACSPVLLVDDVVDAADYYRKRLGFDIDGPLSPDSDFVMVNRDQQRLMLKKIVNPRQATPVWTIVDALWDVFFWVEDVDRAYSDILRLGADVRYPPRNHKDGFFAFSVFDIDDHAIAFGTRRAPAETSVNTPRR